MIKFDYIFGHASPDLIDRIEHRRSCDAYHMEVTKRLLENIHFLKDPSKVSIEQIREIFPPGYLSPKNIWDDSIESVRQSNAYQAIKQQLEGENTMEFKVGDLVKIISENRAKNGFTHWFIENNLQKATESISEPKIEAVVKRLRDPHNHELYWFTPNKFYPVLEIFEDGSYLVIDNDGKRVEMDKEKALLFKVGDRFKGNNSDVIKRIQGFKIENNEIIISYTPFTKGIALYENQIEDFDKYHAKIENKSHEELEPELLPVGTKVRLISMGNRSGEIVYVDSSSKLSLTYIIKWHDEHTEGHSWFNKKDVEKIEEPILSISEGGKPKPEPKFKIGTKVKILDNRLEFKDKVGYVKSYCYRRLFGMSEYEYVLEKEGDSFFPITDIPEMALELVIEEPELKVAKRNLLSIGTKIKIIKCPESFNGPEKLGRIGVITYVEKDTYCGDYVYKVDIDGIYTWCAYNEVEKIEESKPEWKPKFKVGDWVYYLNAGANSDALFQILEIVYKNKSYRVTLPQGHVSCFGYNDDNLELWQPMQELKDKVKVQENYLKCAYDIIASKDNK